MNSTKSRLQIGDIVKLNSGGPAMLVVGFEWGKVVTAYVLNGKVKETSFKAICLSNKKA